MSFLFSKLKKLAFRIKKYKIKFTHPVNKWIKKSKWFEIISGYNSIESLEKWNVK